MKVQSFYQVAMDTDIFLEELNEFIQGKKVLDIKYVVTNERIGGSGPDAPIKQNWINAFVHYEDGEQKPKLKEIDGVLFEV
jgi:hypothetical protein